MITVVARRKCGLDDPAFLCIVKILLSVEILIIFNFLLTHSFLITFTTPVLSLSVTQHMEQVLLLSYSGLVMHHLF